MNKQVILAVLVGIVLGGLLMMLIRPQNQTTNMMSMEHMGDMDHKMDDNDMSMSDMNEMLSGKTGDDFDRAFIEGMIPHHEGAIDMAKQAQISAGHAEIKTMAEAIISTQAEEIEQMKQWYAAWGYGAF